MMYARHVLMDQGEQTDAPSISETESGSGTLSGPQRAEFERLRQKLGFSPPTVIDQRYRVESLLGCGGMGEVYLAHDQRLGRQVALKLVRRSSETKPERLQARLEREALTLARVTHPNVVGIHDVGSHDGQTYFTMQLVPGTSLRKWQDAAPRKTKVIDVYLQAARGLAAAHSVGVVHRDFKPDNVIVGDDGVVRVLDFGLAAALRREGSIPETTERDVSSPASNERTDSGAAETDSTMMDWDRMTQTGALLGTVAYMSSEQLEGRDVDARSDQFAFCVAMWEALTGKRPFTDNTSLGLLSRIERGPIGAMPRPRWLRAILVRGLAHDPRRRWPSMAALIDAIEHRRKRGRKWLLGFGLTSAILGASVLGYILASPEPPPPDETCDAFVGKVDEIWNTGAHEALEAHRKLDAHATDHIRSKLDHLASDWKQTATGLCNGELAPAAHEPTRVCLERWLVGFEKTVTLLAQASNGPTLSRAPDLLVALATVDSDYCVEVPTDPVIWQMAVEARSLAMLGYIADAVAVANAAIKRADGLDTRRFSSERAFAHLARADVAMRSGDDERAMSEFEHALQHADAIDAKRVEIETLMLRAKLLARINAPGYAERASSYIEQAGLKLNSLPGGPHDVLRAELLDASGAVERARALVASSPEVTAKHHEEAIALHHEAQSLFMAAGRPTLAADAMTRVGINYQDLGNSEQARHSYAGALELLDAAQLPPSYRGRVAIVRNLGLLAREHADEPRALAEALRHFEFVLEYGNEDERLEMPEQILLTALELGHAELTQEWLERAAAAWAARPHASLDETFRIQRAVGFALAVTEDPRAELLLTAAESSAAAGLPLESQFNLQTAWVAWLESIGRCDDAAARRDRLVVLLADAEPKLEQEHAKWRATGPTCAKELP